MSHKYGKMMRAHITFHNLLEDLIQKGIFKDKLEATEELTPLIKNNVKWELRPINNTKIKFIKQEAKRRKIELELSI